MIKPPNADNGSMKPSTDAVRTRDQLHREQLRAEKTISLLRLALFAGFTIANLVQALTTKVPLQNEVLPLAGATAFAGVMYLQILFITRRDINRRFVASATKYLYIVIDAALIGLVTAIIYHRTAATPLAGAFDLPIETFLPLLFAFWAFLYLVLDLFRFSPGSSIYTGLVFIGSYAAVLWYLDPAMIEGEFIFYSSIFFAGTTILAAGLCAYFSAHFRRVVARSKRQDQLERFLPETVAKDVLEARDRPLGEAETRDVAVLFADIRGFTALSEQMAPTDLVTFLNTYFGRMIDAVFSNGGTLDKLIGDGLMAIFGAPKSTDHFCLDAVEAGRDMLNEITLLNQARARAGEAPIGVGIGIHAGPVVIGRIGSERRMDYTAIGDVVNTASRLEGLTRKTDVDLIFSRAVKDRLPSDYPVRSLGTAQVRGKRQKVGVYSI